MQDVREMIATLTRLRPSYLEKIRPKRQYKKRKPLNYHVRVTNIRRPFLPLAKKHAILLKYYGSLEAPNFDKPLISQAALAKIAGVT